MSACSESSVLVTISVAGMLDGVSAKFNPFVVLNILWVLTLIFSNILLASSAERVAVMLLAVDSVSFFASPIDFWVSHIRSLGKPLEASSATQPNQRRSYMTYLES